MSVWKLMRREIGHRKLNFILGLLSVSVAIACLVGSLTLLKANDIVTEKILAEKQELVEKEGAALNDAMRKITIGLGFNALILPEDQDLNEFYNKNTLSKSMPEEFVDRLAQSRIVTINHLLPTVSKSIHWDEQNIQIILMGTRGEVPLMHKNPKKPMLDAVPKGKMVVGYQIHQQRNLKKGDKVKLMGKEFEIIETNKERGTVDDSTVWVHLSDAQEMLNMQNLINGIWALECHCAGDRISQIRAEITKILPGTQVIERGTKALARAEARDTAKKAALAAKKREEENRAELKQKQEKFSALFVPLVILGSGVWIGFLMFGNVRQRKSEIGILRAIGVQSTQILMLFLGKAILIGILGAGIGYLIGFYGGISWGELPVNSETSSKLFSLDVLLVSFVLAILLSSIASWIPAMLAAQQDPADILQEE